MCVSLNLGQYSLWGDVRRMCVFSARNIDVHRFISVNIIKASLILRQR